MSAWRSWRGPILLLAGLLVIWQALYWFAGELALRSPMQTLDLTARLLS